MLEAGDLFSSPSRASPPAAPRRLAPGTKRAAVLRTLLELGMRGLTCFEAVSQCHDYVLRSTISDLQRLYGFHFYRKWVQVPGHAGSKVECVRYWLSAEDAARARELLGMVSEAVPAPRAAGNALTHAEATL